MLDYYLLAKELTQMLSDNASRYIAWATGSKRNNNGQRSGWDRCPTEVVAWQRRPDPTALLTMCQFSFCTLPRSSGVMIPDLA